MFTQDIEDLVMTYWIKRMNYAEMYLHLIFLIFLINFGSYYLRPV